MAVCKFEIRKVGLMRGGNCVTPKASIRQISWPPINGAGKYCFPTMKRSIDFFKMALSSVASVKS